MEGFENGGDMSGFRSLYTAEIYRFSIGPPL